MEQIIASNLKHLSNNEANRITREAICTALLYLMDSKDFDKISITELVRKAGVSRQAFYRNYTSKEAIVIEIEETILFSFANSLNDTKYVENSRLWFYDLFCFIQKNEKLILVLHKANLSDMLFSKATFLLEKWAGENTPQLHYHIIGNLGALKAIVLEWFSTGMKESCDDMADLCMRYGSNIRMP